MGGGRETPTLMPTCAIAEMGATSAAAKRTVRKVLFFILVPPLSDKSESFFARVGKTRSRRLSPVGCPNGI